MPYLGCVPDDTEPKEDTVLELLQDPDTTFVIQRGSAITGTPYLSKKPTGYPGSDA